MKISCGISILFLGLTLVFSSGHGDYKKSLNKGYWVPVDAQTESTVGFISNSDIQTFLGGIPSKHTHL
jgi:hypothetical protein